MFSKFELTGAGISVALMVFAIYLLQTQSILGTTTEEVVQPAAVTESGIVFVRQAEDQTEARVEAYLEASNDRGVIQRMVVDDITIGTGAEVFNGDTIVVHYQGTLQNGQEFDNSRKRGEPFEFTVGEGRVISGWEEGVVGMKVGGQRVLVIPPEKAYGSQGVGPIPGNATLVFAIELLEIK